MQQRPQNILRLADIVNNRLQKNSKLQIFNSYFQILQRHEHRVYHSLFLQSLHISIPPFIHLNQH